MKYFLLTILFLLSNLISFGQNPNYLQYIDGDWVTEVNPNSHSELQVRETGPFKVYNKITGEYFVWQPDCNLWKNLGEPLFVQEESGIIKYNGCLSEVRNSDTTMITDNFDYYSDAVSYYDSFHENFNSGDTVDITVIETSGNILNCKGRIDMVGGIANTFEFFNCSDLSIDTMILVKSYYVQNMRKIDSTIINGKTYVAVTEYTLRSLDPSSTDFSSLVTTNVTDMSSLFMGNLTFNQDIGNWDVSNVVNMSGMFHDCDSFNQDISNWDVGKVKTMGGMFYNTEAFNQDINSWNVSKVTDMGTMFFNADGFNQDISSWDVSTVENMKQMFDNADIFNQDLSNWCVEKIKSKPIKFDYNTFNWTLPKPVWGTCPQ